MLVLMLMGRVQVAGSGMRHVPSMWSAARHDKWPSVSRVAVALTPDCAAVSRDSIIIGDGLPGSCRDARRALGRAGHRTARRRKSSSQTGPRRTAPRVLL